MINVILIGVKAYKTSLDHLILNDIIQESLISTDDGISSSWRYLTDTKIPDEDTTTHKDSDIEKCPLLNSGLKNTEMWSVFSKQLRFDRYLSSVGYYLLKNSKSFPHQLLEF